MKFLGFFDIWVCLILYWGCVMDGLMAEIETEKELETDSPYLPSPSLRSYLFPPPPHLPPPPPLFPYRQNIAPFRPSIAIIVGVLTTMFALTFLLLLYAKHCKRSNGGGGHHHQNPHTTTQAARRNSGIDRTVVESLPIFRFSSLIGHKEGLECSVCLNRFEPNEVLRLLPKCKHAFHVECVDTWLDAHSTCPLCRYRVDPEDVLLIEDIKLTHQRKSAEQPEFENRKSEEHTRRISGRHSSAGERVSNLLLQILIQRPGESTQCRRSVDSAISRKRREKDTETVGVGVAVGCFDRGGVRKDGLLLSETAKETEDRENFLRRYDHRIILSTEGGSHKRWSDLRPSDLLFLQSEMMISNTGRYSLSSKKPQGEEDKKSGGNVIKGRSVSEITGVTRFDERREEVGPR